MGTSTARSDSDTGTEGGAGEGEGTLAPLGGERRDILSQTERRREEVASGLLAISMCSAAAVFDLERALATFTVATPPRSNRQRVSLGKEKSRPHVRLAQACTPNNTLQCVCMLLVVCYDGCMVSISCVQESHRYLNCRSVHSEGDTNMRQMTSH